MKVINDMRELPKEQKQKFSNVKEKPLTSTPQGAPQLTESQEREVLEHCITTCTKLIGKKPVGYRAPLYQLRESTIALLEEHNFLYDSSLTHHDSKPYYLPSMPPIKRPDFANAKSAREWMVPLLQVRIDLLKFCFPAMWNAKAT